MRHCYFVHRLQCIATERNKSPVFPRTCRPLLLLCHIGSRILRVVKAVHRFTVPHFAQENRLIIDRVCFVSYSRRLRIRFFACRRTTIQKKITNRKKIAATSARVLSETRTRRLQITAISRLVRVHVIPHLGTLQTNIQCRSTYSQCRTFHANEFYRNPNETLVVRAFQCVVQNRVIGVEVLTVVQSQDENAFMENDFRTRTRSCF